MATPILILPVEREIEKTVKLAEKTHQLGDGYTQSMSLGINPEKLTWAVRSIPLTTAQYNSVESQLRTWQGITPFRWSPDNGVSEPLEAYFCEAWEWTPLGPNAWQLEAEFERDYGAPCEAFADYIDTTGIVSQLEQAVEWVQRNYRDTLPCAVNGQGVAANSFHEINNRGVYTPSSAGTVDTQAILLKALAIAYFLPLSQTHKNTIYYLSLGLGEALETYFYQEAVPTNPTAQTWLPHWIVNSKASFQAKESKFGLTVSFVSGVGNISTGSPNYGDKLAELYKVYSTDSTLTWQDVNSRLINGTEYSINYWVSSQNISGRKVRVYPSSLSSAGDAVTVTTESIGKIVLDTPFTGNAIVVYSTYTGSTINKNQPFDAHPIWRSLTTGEKNVTPNVVKWLSEAFFYLYSVTQDAKWYRAYQANTHSMIAATNGLTNDSYILKKDTTTSNPYSYPGTRFLWSGSVTRLGDGWIQATINSGNSSAELQNVATVIQMQPAVTLTYELNCNIATILEIYVSTSQNIFSNSQNYIFWLPVDANTNYSGSIKPEEFIKYNSGTIWNPRSAVPSITPFTGGTGINTISNVSEIVTIDGFKRLVEKVNVRQSFGGFAGFTLPVVGIGNKPPVVYYSKSGAGAIQLRITDGEGKYYYWNLTDTASGFQKLTPTWANATIAPLGVPSDQPIQAVDFVPAANTNSTCVVSIWYVGDAPEQLPTAAICYRTAVLSRMTVAHTLKAGDVKPVGNPLDVLLNYPGVQPRFINLKNNIVNGWQGSPNVGYLTPSIYDRSFFNYPNRIEPILDFLIQSQAEYVKQNVNNTEGFFAPQFVWPRWEEGIGQKNNTWSFDNWGDPSVDWEGYQLRIAVDCAFYLVYQPTNKKVKNIVVKFLTALDKIQKQNGNAQVPNKYPALLDPQITFISPHANALLVRAALFANIAGCDPSLTFRLIKRNLDYLSTQFVNSGNMQGSWSASQPNFTGSDGQTYKEYYSYWHGEIIETLTSLHSLKNQIIYPPCSTSLT